MTKLASTSDTTLPAPVIEARSPAQLRHWMCHQFDAYESDPPPSHQEGQRAGRNLAKAIAVRPMPIVTTAPPTNQTPTRAATCTPRAMERARAQPVEEPNLQPVAPERRPELAFGQRASPPRNQANTAPTTIASIPVRNIVMRRGSRKGWHCDVLEHYRGRSGKRVPSGQGTPVDGT